MSKVAPEDGGVYAPGVPALPDTELISAVAEGERGGRRATEAFAPGVAAPHASTPCRRASLTAPPVHAVPGPHISQFASFDVMNASGYFVCACVVACAGFTDAAVTRSLSTFPLIRACAAVVSVLCNALAIFLLRQSRAGLGGATLGVAACAGVRSFRGGHAP